MRLESDKFAKTNLAFYAELEPVDRYRAFVDRLFVLRDCGRLIGAGGNLFSSSFSEISLVARDPDDAGQNCHDAIAWEAIHLPPRFGRKPRRRDFRGWIVGVRCRPLVSALGDAALARLSALFTATVAGADSIDALVRALDGWIEHLIPWLETAQSGSSVSEPRGVARVAAMAEAKGVTPRTLQRHFHKHLGLAPKQYTGVQRFAAALRRIALEQDSLAEVASVEGYSDQAHLTADLNRHAGVSPGRFRTQARGQVRRDAVRFFQDADLRSRAHLIVSQCGDEATYDQIQSEGRQFRVARPGELCAPSRDDDARH